MEDDCKEWFQSDDVQKYLRAIHTGETMALRMNPTDEHAEHQVWLFTNKFCKRDIVLLHIAPAYIRLSTWRVHKVDLQT